MVEEDNVGVNVSKQDSIDQCLDRSCGDAFSYFTEFGDHRHIRQ